MNAAETVETTPANARTQCIIEMPLGLLGFEEFKRFSLLTRPAEAPFLRLRALDNPKLAFLVMPPSVVLPAYGPNIAEQDAQFLGLQNAEDGLVLNIVTVRGPQQATINLKGPIVLNRRTLLAKQVIPLNASDLPAAYPLPLRAN